jgi:ankyrin repeat protein
MKKNKVEPFEKAFRAILIGNENGLKDILKDINIETKDKYNRTLLHYSVIENKINLVRVLLENGADSNVSDKKQWKPLHFAAQNNNIEIAQILIQYGADINALDESGNTVIWRATFSSQGKGDMIKFLLSNGAKPDVKNNKKVSALDLADSIGNYNVKQFFN